MQERNMALAKQLHSDLQQMLTRRRQNQAEGIAALHRLVKAATGDTGQSGVVGRFLLGLYNGQAFRFDLTDLRRLDPALHDDCLAVLRMDHAPVQEVHLYLKNGELIWRRLIDMWGGAHQ